MQKNYADTARDDLRVRPVRSLLGEARREQAEALPEMQKTQLGRAADEARAKAQKEDREERKSLMDAFQKAEARRRLIAEQIVPAWVQFRAATESLVGSYNETSEGNLHPAVFNAASEHVLVITSARGMAADKFHYLTLAIEITLEASEYLIRATRETWLTKHGQRIQRRGQESFEFRLNADPDQGRIWFASAEFGQCAPGQAAELLLVRALS